MSIWRKRIKGEATIKITWSHISTNHDKTETRKLITSRVISFRLADSPKEEIFITMYLIQAYHVQSANNIVIVIKIYKQSISTHQKCWKWQCPCTSCLQYTPSNRTISPKGKMLGKEHTYMSDEPSGFSTSVSCSCLWYQHDMQELLNNTSNKQEKETINGAKYSPPPMNHL